MADIRSEVYNALADIAFKYHKRGTDLTEEDFDRAYDWFAVHFWEDEDLDEAYSGIRRYKFDSVLDYINNATENISFNNGTITIDDPNEVATAIDYLSKYYDEVDSDEMDGYWNISFADLKESLNESLTSSEVFRYLDDNFPKLKYLDERDYGDNVALFFKLGGDISGLEDHLNDLGVDWKISNGKLRIIAPEDFLDEEVEDNSKSKIYKKEDAGDVEKGIENFNSMTESILVNNDEIKSTIYDEAKKAMMEFGFPEDEVSDYLFVDVDNHIDEDGDEFIVIEVRAELSYDALTELADHLNNVVQKIEAYAYFEPVTSGIIECWIKK